MSLFSFIIRNFVFLLLIVCEVCGQYVWVRKLSGTTFSVSFNPQNYRTVYAGRSNLSVSYDAGETWQSMPSSPPDFQRRFIAVNPMDTMMMFVGGNGLWRSTNAGITWSLVNSGGFDGESIAIDRFSPNRMYIATFGSGFYRSTDYGATWMITPGTEGSFYCTIAIRPDSTNILFVGSGFGSISKSTDYGLTWRVVHMSSDSSFNETPKIVIDPQNPLTAYATNFDGPGGIWKTTDGGESWIAAGLIGVQLWSLDVDPNNPSHILTGTFGNAVLYRSTDFGQSWSNYSFGLPGTGDHWMVKVIPSDTVLAFLALYPAGIYKLERGTAIIATPWPLTFPAGRKRDTVSTTFYVQNNEDTVRVDSIKGKLFTYAFTPPTPVYPPASYDSVRASLVLPTTLGTFYDTIYVWSRDFLVNPYQYSSKIQVSPDFTVSPSELLFPIRMGGDTVKAYFYVQNVFDTIRVDSIRGIRYNYTFEPPLPTFFPSVRDSVLVSVVLPPTPGFFRDTILIWSRDSHVNPYRVPTRLRILTGIETLPSSPETYHLHQNYPNPFNPSTQITYDLPKQSFVRLSIVNVLGQEIRVLVQSVQQPGRHAVEFDAGSLASGVYFYWLQASDFHAVRKMILMR